MGNKGSWQEGKAGASRQEGGGKGSWQEGKVGRVGKKWETRGVGKNVELEGNKREPLSIGNKGEDQDKGQKLSFLLAIENGQEKERNL